MTEVIMPKMGDGMEEGTLLDWLKAEGELVRSGEVIGTIQTDKATLELEAPASGVLSGILIAKGQTVPVGTPIAALLKTGEALPAGWGKDAPESESAPEKTAEAILEPSPSLVEAVSATFSPQSEPSARVKASPLARKIAKEAGIDLARVVGTGPGGRIVESDVKKAIDLGGFSMPAAGTQPSGSPPIPLAIPKGQDQRVELNRLRQIIAQRTQQSKQQAPHFYVTVEVDLERILDVRKQFEQDASGKVSINDFVVKASARALEDMPEVNAAFQETSVLRFGSIHVGIAAAVDEGLLVPVIKHANLLTLRQISDESKRLVARAREGKLLPDEMGGSTFSISNMGMLDVDNFIAIINQPNSAIIAVSSARKKVVVNESDELEVRTRMNITGSFDHRVLDGAVGARFMNVLKSYLENPTRLLA